MYFKSGVLGRTLKDQASVEIIIINKVWQLNHLSKALISQGSRTDMVEEPDPETQKTLKKQNKTGGWRWREERPNETGAKANPTRSTEHSSRSFLHKV